MSVPPANDPYGQPPSGGQYGPPQGQQPYGPPPGQGYGPPPGQGYGQQPGYGSMPPPPPGSFGQPAGARPGMVTAAAVLAFIIGGLNLLGALVIFAASSILVTGFATFWAVVGLAFAGGLIFAGVQTLNGKDGRLIVILAGVGIIIQIIGMISYFIATQLVGLIVLGLIIYFVITPQAKAWFDSKGAKHF